MARTISALSPDVGGQDIRLTPRGDLEVVTDLEDVRQRTIERLRFWLGQWYAAYRKGVPYRSEIFTRPISAGLASTIVSDHIRTVDGVRQVKNVRARIDPRTRVFFYTATCVSNFGEFEVGDG